MTQPDIARRFGGVARLYGDVGLQQLQKAHIGIVGIGGVGSWAVEALARNAVGKLTLIDLDNVAESNVNRQVHALEGQFGKAKVDAMQQRVLQINPLSQVNVVEDFITPENISEILAPTATVDLDVLIDCTDDAKAKVAMAVYCQKNQLPLFVSGSAGGRLDLTKIKTADLAHVHNDKLLAKLRQQLRKLHGFPPAINPKKPKRMGVNCVYSDEVMIKPSTACDFDSADAEKPESTAITGLNCAGYGSSVSVTASFGFALAQLSINQLLS